MTGKEWEKTNKRKALGLGIQGWKEHALNVLPFRKTKNCDQGATHNGLRLKTYRFHSLAPTQRNGDGGVPNGANCVRSEKEDKLWRCRHQFIPVQDVLEVRTKGGTLKFLEKAVFVGFLFLSNSQRVTRDEWTHTVRLCISFKRIESITNIDRNCEIIQRIVEKQWKVIMYRYWFGHWSKFHKKAS